MKLLAPLLLGLAMASTGIGHEVVYSWNGIIVKETDEDPWFVGDLGKPFNISVIVNQSAREAFLAMTVSNADFLPLSIAFSIDGMNASQIITDQYDTIQFWDDLFSATFDQITVPFVAEFHGVALPLLSAVRIPSSTFSFILEEELPPVFGMAITSHAGGGTRGSLYGLSDPAGVEVTAVLVPEPPVGVILMGFATTSTYVRCFRSRKGRS